MNNDELTADSSHRRSIPVKKRKLENSNEMELELESESVGRNLLTLSQLSSDMKAQSSIRDEVNVKNHDIEEDTDSDSDIILMKPGHIVDLKRNVKSAQDHEVTEYIEDSASDDSSVQQDKILASQQTRRRRKTPVGPSQHVTETKRKEIRERMKKDSIILSRFFVLPSRYDLNTLYATYTVYMKNSSTGLGIIFKNDGNRPVVQDFMETFKEKFHSDFDKTNKSSVEDDRSRKPVFIVSPAYIRPGDFLISVNHLDTRSGGTYRKLMNALKWVEPIPKRLGERPNIKYQTYQGTLCLRFVRILQTSENTNSRDLPSIQDIIPTSSSSSSSSSSVSVSYSNSNSNQVIVSAVSTAPSRDIVLSQLQQPQILSAVITEDCHDSLVTSNEAVNEEIVEVERNTTQRAIDVKSELIPDTKKSVADVNPEKVSQFSLPTVKTRVSFKPNARFQPKIASKTTQLDSNED